MTAADHAAEACPHPTWCQAHTPCRCPYAATAPHPRAGCRYATDDDQEEVEG